MTTLDQLVEAVAKADRKFANIEPRCWGDPRRGRWIITIMLRSARIAQIMGGSSW